MKIKELDKSLKDSTLPLLFDILYSNMHEISPMGNTYEEELADWISRVSPALEKAPRRILIIYDGDEIVGFFQYFVNNGLFMMEEIQLRDAYKGSGVFRELYTYLTGIIPENTELTEAYADKNNHKSIEILSYLSLEIVEEDESFYHFRGRYENILRKYGKNDFNER